MSTAIAYLLMNNDDATVSNVSLMGKESKFYIHTVLPLFSNNAAVHRSVVVVMSAYLCRVSSIHNIGLAQPQPDIYPIICDIEEDIGDDDER